MTHEEIQSDLPLLALGTLDPGEQRDVEAHLAGGCAACQRDLEKWYEVVSALPLQADEVAPSHLRPKLLQRLQAPMRPGQVIPLRRQWALPLAAAASLLVVIGGLLGLRLQTALHEQQQLVADLRSELDGAASNYQRLAQTLAEKDRDVTALRAALAAAQDAVAVLQRPGLQLVRLKQTPDAQPAEAHALISTESHRALFYAFDLPPVPADKTYELWWITEKEGPVNAGLFLPDQNRVGRVEAAVPAGVGTIKAAAVTIEPASGLPKPTGPMVLLGNL